MGLFDKKYCSICGDKIGLLGNKKLEDGNLCKNCAAKLSPFFNERRHSTVAQIKEQLEYREANKAKVASFNTTRTFDADTNILMDEDNSVFMVTSARNLAEANPDVIEFSKVTGVDIEVDEDSDEEERRDSEGNYVSYNPPRYHFDYDFDVIIHVNHPYFDNIRVRLNPSSVRINETAVTESMKPDPNRNAEYVRYMDMAQEIKETLCGARRQARENIAAAEAPKAAVKCSCCGATTFPDASGRCEYCGGPVA